VAPDLRGHGLSPSTTGYRFAEIAMDLASVGSAWDLVVGHSLGGPIVAAFGLGPGRPDRLLLLDPLLDVPDDEFDALVSGQLSELDPAATAESIREMHPDWDLEDCFHKAVGARSTSRGVVERSLRDNAPYHHVGMLDALSVPTMILGSDPDCGALFHPASADLIDNPLVSYQELEGTGHSVQREQPSLVVAEVLAQLS
jgi:pimeloyl-ACP methyl ester carboxylesterase